MPGEEARLDVRDKSHCCPFSQERVKDLLLFSLLVCHDKGLARVVVHPNSAARKLLEITGGHLATIDPVLFTTKLDEA